MVVTGAVGAVGGGRCWAVGSGRWAGGRRGADLEDRVDLRRHLHLVDGWDECSHLVKRPRNLYLRALCTRVR